MGTERGKEAALVVGGGAVGALIVALLTKREGAVLPLGEVVFHLDDETREALGTIISLLQDQKAYLATIAAKEFGAGILANKGALTIGQVNVPIAGTAVQLPEIAIPDGFKVIILAKPGNAGFIYMGTSAPQAGDATSYFDRLDAGDSISLQITTLDLIWINASVNAEGITYIVEQA